MSAKQVILITGSSTGFGRMFAESLARKGHTVFASMRDPQGKNARNAGELLALAKKESLAIHVVELDVTSEASVENAIRSVIAQAGRIDVAINNAGYPVTGLMETVTTEQAQQIFATNFFGALRVDRAALPHMRRQRSGVLMHISSGAGRVVFPAFGIYCATKYAMEAAAEAYRYELASQGIESVIVEPGAYETPIMGKFVTGADAGRADTYGPLSQVPQMLTDALIKSAGNPQEVADAVINIIETPPGQKKLRYRVSPSDVGVDAINEVSEKIQAGLLQAFGLSTITAFTQQQAAASD
ncbi:MAG TPA: SDR family oxidoreductase [Candidatus Eisenbacteria bacterium]|nr:SDR family oxidoreductase [Candidatus Eisenbacteria bacterium]